MQQKPIEKQKTAIIFMMDPNEMKNGRKINYYTEALRKIDQIDK